MSFRTSVSRRLVFLVTIQTAIALLLVGVAVRTLSRLSADYKHMYEFQFASVAAIGKAMAETANLKSGARSVMLDEFYRRYRAEWETAAGSNSDAISFRQDLTQAGASDLARLETQTLADLESSMDSGDAASVKESLAALHRINVKYAEIDNFYVMQRIEFGRNWIIIIGLAGSVLILFLGLHVRRAIAPRIKGLVAHIRDFQESGKVPRIADGGKDDIAVLANALDAGFTAIASREREREQFLSIAAHELKTPVTSIHGYASLLVNHPPRAVDVDRALKSINRQSWRLSRLIDALFLAMKARTGKLNFEPKPFDMSALVDRVLVEMEPLMTQRTFVPQIDENVSILGDEALLEHALWALFTCASTFAVENSSMHVAFFAIDQRARLTVAVNAGSISIPEIEELFRPFRFVEYETGSGIRAAVGLYLCREIVRLHNGSLRVEELSELRPQFVMDVAR